MRHALLLCLLTMSGCLLGVEAQDMDGDGAEGRYVFGTFAENQREGWDCDDGDPDVNPDADEICDDEVDNNCDQEIDEEACVEAE